MARGELAMTVLLAVLGLVWAALAWKLPYMGDFAPGSGFLPLWLALALAGLSALHAVRLVRRGVSRGPDEAAFEPGGWRKPIAVIIGLTVCVVAIEALGFVASVTLFMVYLMRVVERENWRPTLIMSTTTPVGLWMLFHLWLSVPLPKGPWGF